MIRDIYIFIYVCVSTHLGVKERCNNIERLNIFSILSEKIGLVSYRGVKHVRGEKNKTIVA